MPVDNPTPEQDPKRGMLEVVGLSALGAIPLVGPLSAGVVGEALRRQQRLKDEEFFAMTSARLAALERDGVRVDPEDEEFLAAAAYGARIGRETADAEKLRILAIAVANSGSWSTLSLNDREEFLRLASEMSVAETAVLTYLDDPGAYGSNYDDGGMGAVWTVDQLEEIRSRFRALSSDRIEVIVKRLESRGLADVRRGQQMPENLSKPMSSLLGAQFIEFLRGAHNRGS